MVKWIIVSIIFLNKLLLTEFLLGADEYVVSLGIRSYDSSLNGRTKIANDLSLP